MIEDTFIFGKTVYKHSAIEGLTVAHPDDNMKATIIVMFSSGNRIYVDKYWNHQLYESLKERYFQGYGVA